MAIFRRRKNTDDASTGASTPDDVDDAVESEESALDEGVDESDVSDESQHDEADPPFSRARGPFDVSEVSSAQEDGILDVKGPRIDLGAISLVPLDGMQLRLDLDDAQEQVLSAQALLGESSVQVQAFAGPRTFGIWQEIRDEIAQSVAEQGGTADVVDGALGRELLCRIPGRGPDGRTAFSQVRFAGVDGPRWFLRAVFSGPAALDDAAAEPFVGLVRSVVVTRGDAAMPPREVLVLTLPSELTGGGPGTGEPGESSDDGYGGDEERPPRVDDLLPFERGPEITEVR